MLFDIYCFANGCCLPFRSRNEKLRKFQFLTSWHHRDDGNGDNSKRTSVLANPKCIDHLSRCPSIHVNCVSFSSNPSLFVNVAAAAIILLYKKHSRPFSFFLCSTALVVKWISFVKCFKFQLWNSIKLKKIISLEENVDSYALVRFSTSRVQCVLYLAYSILRTCCFVGVSVK